MTTAQRARGSYFLPKPGRVPINLRRECDERNVRFASIATEFVQQRNMSRRAISGCSGAWLPPPKYRNSEAPKKGYSLVAHFHPVPDRRGVSVKNLTRPAQKTVGDPVKNTVTMKEGRDPSLDKARPHLSDAIDTQIDCDDASDDLIKEKLHSTSVHQVRIGRPGGIARRFGRVDGLTQACMSATWFVVWPDLVLVQMRE